MSYKAAGADDMHRLAQRATTILCIHSLNLGINAQICSCPFAPYCRPYFLLRSLLLLLYLSLSFLIFPYLSLSFLIFPSLSFSLLLSPLPSLARSLARAHSAPGAGVGTLFFQPRSRRLMCVCTGAYLSCLSNVSVLVCKLVRTCLMCLYLCVS